MREALYWEKSDGHVRCRLCPHECLIADGRSGLCLARKNQAGCLKSLSYGQVTSANLDPVEKKPLFHFYPGRQIFSIGTFGCNLRCPFCQNWTISQQVVETEELSPDRANEIAERYKSIGIAFTYNEPFIWFEYVLDTAKKARAMGLKNVLVTNGFVNEKPLLELLPYIDAMNIDIKAMDEYFYKEKLSGRLMPVLRTVELSHSSCHVELTNLLIPTLNDSVKMIERLVDWVADLSPDIPMHFSRYFPQYKFSLPPTSLATLDQAGEIARKKLRYVYMGNVVDDESNTTFCPGCRKPLIERHGYSIARNDIVNGRCRHCDYSIKGVFK